VLGVVVANAGDTAAITRQMKELDVNVKMFGATHSALPGYYKLAGKLGEFVYGTSVWEADLPYPGNQEFVDAYHKEFKRAPAGPAAAAYAACQLWREAVRRAGSLDADKVREELLKLKTTTVFGSFAVDERGFQIGHRDVAIQWQQGKKVVVWPDEAATGKPRFPTPPWSER
jgi:branched-chain amino acid transport system substrate-binding protein